MDLVAEKGYEATTAAEIGLRAGFSRAMVHARYGTKDVLLDELMRTEYQERLVPDIEPDASGLQQVQAIIDRLDALASEDERFLKAMFKLSFEAVRGSPSLTPRITAWLCNLEAAVGERLKTGKKDGSIRAEVDIAVATRDIMVTGTGIAFTWIVMPGSDLHNEYARWKDRIADDYGPTPRQP
jgi:AcrR family transcriptional regulator